MSVRAKGDFQKEIYSIAERGNKVELRAEEESEKAESCRENSWNEIQLKGPKRQKYTQEQNKKGVGKLGWFMSGT